MNQGEAQRYAYTYFLECSTGQITSSGGIADELRENTSLVSGKRVFETSVDTGQGVPSLTHSGVTDGPHASERHNCLR